MSARTRGVGGLRLWLRGLVGGHARALVASIGRLHRAPLPSLLTAAVIGIALALPAAFLGLLQNVGALTGDWESGARISVFLDKTVAPERYTALAAELGRDDQVASTRLITPEQALEEFRQGSGFDEALALLDDNPLPPVILVEPRLDLDAPTLELLALRLDGLPEVELVQMDREWVQRLRLFMELISRGIWVVAGMLAMAVVLVVGNTIRLDIQSRRDEIVVVKLLGGTDAFIRRPFLYEGLCYGFGGGVLAAVMVTAAHLLLSGPARELAALYGSGFGLRGLGLEGLAVLLLSGAILGLLGSWLAVGRHLGAIEPR